MSSYKIKKYYLKKTYSPNNKKRYIIKAKIFKYKFGFLVDILKEDLCDKYKCSFEGDRLPFYYRQSGKRKKEAKIILQQLNNNL